MDRTDGTDGMDDIELRALLERTRKIVVVGLSPSPDRASHQVAWYLAHQGYEVVGVNPEAGVAEVAGIPVVASLADVTGQIDLVDVFRRPAQTPGVAREAVEVGAKAVWLQLGIRSDEARRITRSAGLDFVEDRCTKVEHARLLR